MTVLLIVQKAFDLRCQGQAASLAVHHKDNRRIGNPCHLVSAGGKGIAANPVIISHDTFQNGKFRALCPFAKQRAQLFF